MALTRERFRELIGLEEPPISLRSAKIEARDGYVVEHLRLSLGGEEVRGVLLRPTTPGPHPAILFGHSHGDVYDIGAMELLDGRDYLFGPPGPALARAGFVALCIDMPIFGERATMTEAAASKALLWYGQSLFGRMLCDHSATLTYLASRPDVDASRIGAYGLSMGCTLSYWLAAMDERIAAVAHLCCFADLREMIRQGAHNGHGIYLMVPGLLNEADAGAIGALIAPRPQLICLGEADRLTPPEAVAIAWAETSAAYAGAPEALRLVSEPGVGHRETETMRKAVLEFFAETLGR